MINIDKEVIVKDLKSAYRKWKSAAYFDPFLTIDARRIADFEVNNRINDNDSYFHDLADRIIDDENREKLIDGIIHNIRVRCFPKGGTDKQTNSSIISNSPKTQKKIEKIQYFIDLPVEGHILGAMWVIKFGCLLDRNLNDQCFGNRIRKTVLSDKPESPTPYLYYPYYIKYESWRDDALRITEKLLDNKLNVVMVSLDIKGYFYNCRINFDILRKYIDHNKSNDLDSGQLSEYSFLMAYLERVYITYSKNFFHNQNEPADEDQNPMIPIGFFPSGVISNWYLSEFDKAVREKINPQYYGRYVDDILMVFSINDDKFDN